MAHRSPPVSGGLPSDEGDRMLPPSVDWPLQTVIDSPSASSRDGEPPKEVRRRSRAPVSPATEMDLAQTESPGARRGRGPCRPLKAGRCQVLNMAIQPISYLLVIFAGWLRCGDVAIEAAGGPVGRSPSRFGFSRPWFWAVPGVLAREEKPTGAGIRRRGAVRAGDAA
jgi:hypothetical protein